MSTPGLLSERAIILAPHGRDSQIALMILQEAGFPALVAHNLGELNEELILGAGMVIIADEALRGIDISPLLQTLERQMPWSDIPIVLLTRHGGPLQNPSAHLGSLLGNVTFLERPFHPATLVSLVTTAIRSRRRQYEARARMADMAETEQRAIALLLRRQLISATSVSRTSVPSYLVLRPWAARKRSSETT